MDNSLRFKDGKFKIMQIADTQEIFGVNPDTVRLISLALDREKPDLVVFTGDQIKGYSATFKGDTRRKVTSTLSEIFRPIVERGIPFTATFGNHDNNCSLENSELMEIYKAFPGFLCSVPRNERDAGTFSLPINTAVMNATSSACILSTPTRKKRTEHTLPFSQSRLIGTERSETAFAKHTESFFRRLFFSIYLFRKFSKLLKE